MSQRCLKCQNAIYCVACLNSRDCDLNECCCDWAWSDLLGGYERIPRPCPTHGTPSRREGPDAKRFITDATDLLAALRLFVTGPEARFMRGYRAAIAAIAKAEGKSEGKIEQEVLNNEH